MQGRYNLETSYSRTLQRVEGVGMEAERWDGVNQWDMYHRLLRPQLVRRLVQLEQRILHARGHVRGRFLGCSTW